METLDRYVRAMKRQSGDRVPIGSMISLPYWSQGLGIGTGLSDHLAAHPLLWIELQEEIGFDSVLIPAKPENLTAFVETARYYGQYP